MVEPSDSVTLLVGVSGIFWLLLFIGFMGWLAEEFEPKHRTSGGAVTFFTVGALWCCAASWACFKITGWID